MSEPKLRKPDRLDSRLANCIKLDLHVPQRALIIAEVRNWLRGCAKQAENDEASVAPEIIDGLIEGLADGRL